MATSDSNRELKIWDVRQLKSPIKKVHKLAACATSLAFSQTDMLALGMGNVVQIFK